MATHAVVDVSRFSEEDDLVPDRFVYDSVPRQSHMKQPAERSTWIEELTTKCVCKKQYRNAKYALVNFLIIIINIAVFSASIHHCYKSADTDNKEEQCKEFKGNQWFKTIEHFGFCYGPYITDGEWWRIIVSNYIHDNNEHIITNLLIASVAGTYLEVALGHFWYLFIILFSTIWVGFSCPLFDYNVATIGFSGIVFAMFGAQLGYMIVHWKRLQTVRIVAMVVLISLIVYEIYLQYRQTFKNVNSGVSHIAHLSGAFSGFLAAMGIVKLTNHAHLIADQEKFLAFCFISNAQLRVVCVLILMIWVAAASVKIWYIE